MKQINWSEYKFRASSLGKIMSNGRSKNQLSEKAKEYLRDLWIQEVYSRSKEFSSKYTAKGNFSEKTESLDIISEYYGYPFQSSDVSNSKLENDYISGHPDILSIKDRVIDIKSSWNLDTFLKADGTNLDYYWQGQAYMWLTDRKIFDLAYCLTDATEIQINTEVRTSMRNSLFEYGSEEWLDEQLKWTEYHHNLLTFGDIPTSEKIRVFRLNALESVDPIIAKIQMAREYLYLLDETMKFKNPEYTKEDKKIKEEVKA